jgi:putative ABC transport system permease protein
MFLTYLRRELRSRMRQAVIISLGLALGIGLVLTVTALSSGVKNAQGQVLHSLYGLDTDIAVTKTPSTSSFRGGRPTFFHFGQGGSGKRPKAGTKITEDNLTAFGEGTLTSSDVSAISKLKNVAAVAGGLTLTDTKTSFTIPNSSSGGGFGPGGGTGSFHPPTTISVDGVDLAGNAGAAGPLSNATKVAGRTFTSADADANVALVNSNYAKDKLSVGSTITLAKTSFKVIGIVSQSPSSNPPDVYIPLQRAQALGTIGGKSLKGDVTSVYVTASNAGAVGSVSSEISRLLPKAKVTNQDDLAKQLTGSLSSTASLASSLGRWLSIAVLIAAFLLASLLTIAAVSRRVREFGTLKALGWRSRRVVGQVIGESLVIGAIGGVIGIGLGYVGAALVNHFTGPLTASPGQTTGSGTPGGARTFGGGGFPGSGGFPGAGGGAPGGNRFRFADAASSPVVHVHLNAAVTGEAILAAVLLAVLGGLISGAFGGWRAAQLRPAAALARVA